MAMVKLQDCYDRAHRYLAQGEYDKAEAVCEHILQYYPQDLGTLQLLGQIYLERKQPRKAREYYQQVLEIDPENVSAHWGMGIAYEDEKDLEEAVAELERALEIKPDLPDLRNHLLRLYTQLYGESRAQLRLNRAGLGRLYVKGEMLDKAIDEFREVLKTEPDRADVQLSLIEALWRSGDVDGAAQVCEEVLQRLPNALKANLILGYARFTAGRREEGEQLWRRAAACDPNNAMARAIFEMAPMRIPHDFLPYEAATLPDFDEKAWETMRPAAPAPVPAPERTRPAPAAPPPAPEVVRPAPAPEPEPLGVSWLDQLATGEGAIPETEGVAPFRLEEIEAMEPSQPGTWPEEEAAPAELGLTPEEIAAVWGPETRPEPQAAPTGAEEELLPGIAPFSLEDLGATAGPPEEVSAPTPEEPVEAGVAPFSLEGLEEAELGEVKPFSLEDLGLEAPAAEVELEELPEEAAFPEEEELEALPAFSWQEPGARSVPGFVEELVAEEEQPAGPTIFEKLKARRQEVLGPSAAEAAPVEEAAPEELLIEGVQPFSVEEVEAPPAEEEVPLERIRPFSLEELGLEAPAAAPPFPMEEAEAPVARGAPAAEEAGIPAFAEEELEGIAPFSLEELERAGTEEAPVGVEPFSLEELGLEAPELPPEEEAVVAPAVEEAAQPFSLEELGLTEEEIVGLELGPEETVPLPVEEAVVEIPAEAAVTAERLPLDELRARVVAEPADEALRLELARSAAEEGAFDEGVDQYRWLIKNGSPGTLETVIADIHAWLEKEPDGRRLQRLHRLLGDAYMKAGSYAQAVQEYAWVLSWPAR